VTRYSARLAVLAVALGACGGATTTTTLTTTTTTGDNGMELTSTAFRHEARIPSKYTCDGTEVSPPLQIARIPANAVTLALIVEDPDAPRGTWDHWIVYDIPVMTSIPEGVGPLGTIGVSTGGISGYESPCPPSGSHRYVFTVYALDATLGLAPGANKIAVLAAIEGHVLASATLLGRYSR
jgi:Raf kinase inhibitor-like YbhB/YbcL family protein